MVKISLEDMPDLITADDIANYLGIHRDTVYHLLKLKPDYGGIKNFKVGALYRIFKVDFIKWMDDQVGDPTPAKLQVMKGGKGYEQS